MKRYEFMDGSPVETKFIEGKYVMHYLAPNGCYYPLYTPLSAGLIREVDVAPDLDSVETWKVIMEKVGSDPSPSAEYLRFHASNKSSFAKKIMQRLEDLGMLEAFLDD